MGDKWSVAWRVLDAQFWGVPQRRRRIALVADFGGKTAPEILFVRKGLSGNSEQSKPKRKEAAGCFRESSDRASYSIQGPMIGRDDKNGPQGDGINEDVCFTLNTADRHAVVYGISSYHSNAMISDNPHSGIYEANTARTLDSLNCGYPGCNQGGMMVVEPCEKVASLLIEMTSTKNTIIENGISPTLTARMGTGGNQVNAVTCLDVGFFNSYEELTPTLLARGYKDPHVITSGKCIVRRLTPLECERLQGFPDGWTDIGDWVDSKGKKHKAADSPRYKALGNSIAIPPWKWVLKRLCACYERDATMASLFDGIGGFPLIWEQINGEGSCLWASEIEEFPMAVTKIRFGND